MNSKLILAAVAIIIVAAGGFYFMNANKSTTTSVTNDSIVPTSAAESGATTSPSAMSGSEITVEGSEFKLTPSKITVKKGEKVKLTFKNAGKFPHDYVISELNVATKRINPGETDTVEFTPEKTGEFKFICSVGNHEEQGMVGTLIVE